MQQTKRRDREEIKQLEAIKLRRMSNTTTAIVRMENSFLDIMEGIMSFAGVFRLQFWGNFIWASIVYILDDMMLSYYLSMHSRSSYLQ